MAYSLDNAPIWPPLPTVQDKVNEAIVKVDAITSFRIISGFNHDVRGVTYHFSYQESDQTNFAQANTRAILSLTLGNTPLDVLKATYGTTEDGELNKSNLPVALPTEYMCEWNGHLATNAVVLQLNINEYFALSAAGGVHLENCFTWGRGLKNRLMAASSIDEVEAICKEVDLDALHREACQTEIDPNSSWTRGMNKIKY